MSKINKDEFISILQERGWYSFEDSGIDFRSALPRGIQSIIEGMLVTGLYKMKGTIVFKEGCYPDAPILVGDRQDAKQEKDGAVDPLLKDALVKTNQSLIKENEELKAQLTEANTTIKKQSKWMDDNDKEFFALEKEHKELKTKMEQIQQNGNSSQESYNIDGVQMSVEDIVCGYMAKCRVIDEKENDIKKLQENMDEQLQKQIWEIVKKNEYLQEDLTKALKQVDEYKQEAANTAKYFLKFKVSYDIMIENGAKEPDKKLVDKEVQNLLKAKEEL